jgi:two-component system sensor histidine kinase/response regulator
MDFFDKYLHLVVTAPEAGLIYTGSYSPWLVLLSVSIAIFASYTALLVAELSSQTTQVHTRNTLLVLGGLALGAGIWSMHFVGMLGFSLPCTVNYDPWVTTLSMLPGMLASILSLSI